ncbi:hypothetical protein SacmaDRAFT_1026 [Saccharomonospora marina XMU15]|uniref:SalK n=1 Tax=Saccharomonospora marina XMU15 TaxID=882083 RepID=H5XB83_9PSEU|nr:hypothetical protein [Saccharomonospora marina]EHR49318.1 hypothetical protein SacmaDRAFT_1026 [Saccharomonospora marina XMU15]
MDDEARAATRHCYRVLEPIHSMIYFAPEAEQAYLEAGLDKGGRLAYFASRAAALGPVGAGVVAATFYNFNPELVGKHIPRAWTLASPADLVSARADAAGTALRRLLGEQLASSDALAELAELARQAAQGAEPDGRPLFAAHADLDWPTDPVVVLWHAATLLREYRGDGHIASLLNHGIAGLPALVTHTATGKGFLPEIARKLRGWSQEEWDSAQARLREEGIVDHDGALTERGVAMRERIEGETDAASSAPWSRLGADKTNRVRELAKELSRAVVAAGAYPSGLFASQR